MKWIVGCLVATLLVGCEEGGTSGANQPPIIQGTPPSSVSVNESYIFIPTVTDANGDTLTFSITNPPSWSNFDTATGELSGVPGSIDVGDYNNIVISVSDGTDSAAIQAFTISVIGSNNPP
ncbi:MAG: putative Ig domain-containing protein, partial [Candidatus Thiodiazotropha sp.]